MKRNKKILILIIIITIVISLIYYKRKSGHKNQAFNFPTPQVTASKIKKHDDIYKLEYIGRVSGYKEVELKAQIEGVILNKLYSEGKLVEKGDLLFSIDPNPYLAANSKSIAQLASAKSNLKEAEKAWNRSQKLFKKNAISEKDKDSSLANYEKALNMVSQAEADLKVSELNLEYTNVTSPIKGVVGKENFSEGNLVKNGSILTKIFQTDTLYIDFAYPENDYNNILELIQSGKISMAEDRIFTANIKLANGKILDQIGIVNFMDSRIDPYTASINARIKLENFDSKLIPGQFVSVIINNLTLKDIAIIPEKSVIKTPAGAIVYSITDDKKIAAKPVELGPLTKEGLIIFKGLNDGDLIVTEGIMKAKVNEEVIVINNPEEK